jgi:hypothetical protein
VLSQSSVILFLCYAWVDLFVKISVPLQKYSEILPLPVVLLSSCNGTVISPRACEDARTCWAFVFFTCYSLVNCYNLKAEIVNAASDPRRMRRIIAEDPSWNIATVPSLVGIRSSHHIPFD